MSHPSHRLNATSARKVLKTRLNVVVAELAEAIGGSPLVTMAARHLCVVMRLNVTDGGKVCVSHNEDTVITSLKPPTSLFCLPVHLCQTVGVFFVTAFILQHSSSWTESKGMNRGPGLVSSLNNAKLLPDIIARCSMCFRKPLCKFLSPSSAVNHNERAYTHTVYKGTTQCNETMRETPGQHIGNTPKSVIVRFVQYCVLLSLHAVKYKERNKCSQ